jgi:hypothetical protein
MMSSRRLVTRGLQLFVATLACLALLTPGARAQPSSREYEDAIRAAVQEYEAGKWTEAIMLFRRAHGLAPSARTHRGLGLAYYEASDYVKAVEHLDAALADTRRPLTGGQRQSVKDALLRARAMVGELLLRVTPATASVTIDGRALTAHAKPIRLNVGLHTLELHAPGHASERRTVDVVGEQRSALTIALQPSAGRGTASGPAQRGRDDQRLAATDSAAASDDAGLPLGPIVLLGAGGAALSAALVTGLLEKSKEDELVEAGCETGCDVGYESTRDQARTLQVATNVLLVTGLTAVAASALWLWLGGRDEAPEPRAVQATAMCTPAGCSAALGGTW